MTERDIQGPAGRLHVDDAGSGAGVPTLFAHSFAGTISHWREQLEHLRAGRRAVAFDLRGHGDSEPPADADYAVSSIASDIGAVAVALGLERFVLVGHSLGGAAGIAYAGAHPERVAGLVLVAAPGKLPDEQVKRVIGAMEADYEKTSAGFMERLLSDAAPDVRAQVLSEFQRMPRDAALGIIKATFAYDPLPDLERFGGPSLSITTGDAPDDLHRLVPHLPHDTVAGASHWMQMDEPEAFDRILDDFLVRIDEAEAHASTIASEQRR